MDLFTKDLSDCIGDRHFIILTEFEQFEQLTKVSACHDEHFEISGGIHPWPPRVLHGDQGSQTDAAFLGWGPSRNGEFEGLSYA